MDDFEYTADKIEVVLPSIAAVRKRPGMYIGSTSDGSGLLHMVWELVANSLDQFLQRACSRIDVTLAADGTITVADDGAGMPVHDHAGVSLLQQVFTEFHNTPTADGHAPHEHLTRNGVGLMPVNALSSSLTVHTHRGGVLYSQGYERGAALTPVRHHGPSAGRGTTITFLPDAEIFQDTWIDAGRIAVRLRELAWLHPPLQLRLTDRRTQIFHAPDGLADHLRHLCAHRAGALGPWHVTGSDQEIRVRVAAVWLPGHPARIESFVNSERTSEHGTHVEGLLRALVHAVRQVLPEHCRQRSSAQLRRRIAHGLHAIVSVSLFDPRYGHPARDELRTPRAGDAVCSVCEPALLSLLGTDVQLRTHLIALLADRH